MKLSVIVPCFNEELVVEAMHTALLEVLPTLPIHSYELIFVDDGSSDKTLTLLQQLSQKNEQTNYISFSRNFGKESSMLAGLEYASGDAVVILDADLQHPPSLLSQLLEAYQEGYDQVIAKRQRTGDSKTKTFFAKWYYKLVNRLTDVEMLDGLGDFRLLSRKAVNALLSMKEYNRFSKGLFSWIGFNQKIIAYENQQRAAGTTKFSLKKLLNYGIQGLISFNDKPLRVCFQLGLACIVVSFLYILFTFIMILKDGIAVGGYFTTISAIMILGGVQLLSIGILGEYIGKIYYEVKKRPHYLVDKTSMKKPVEREQHENF